MSDIRQ